MSSMFSRLSDTLTAIRIWTVNLLTLAFLIYLVVLVVSVMGQRPKQVDPAGRVLILSPQGVIVDQQVAAPSLKFPPDLDPEPQIQIRDLLRVIRAAAADQELAAVTVDFSEARFAGPSTALKVAEELAALRDSGKPVIAYGDVLTTSSYLVASQANEVYVHPAGALVFSGLGGYRDYARELAEKLKLTIHDYSQGEYKSATESLTRNDMSQADRAQSEALYFPIWEAIKSRVASARGVEPALLQRFADDYPVPIFPEGAYDNLTFAESNGLIDGTLDFPAYRAMMMERFGVDEDAERETYPYITGAAYYAQLPEEEPDTDDAVAVVFAQGLLVRGEVEPGIAGADDIADLIRRAYEDKDTRALVLRVNSPGGLLMPSEMIRNELLKARERGLPVVVSMGDYAASGGMWIASPADRIYAMPTTITGSIGVALVVPTAENAFDWAGVHFDGVQTSANAGWGPGLPIDDALDAVFHRFTSSSYQRFIDVVAEGRNRDEDYVRSIAGGRVWLGNKGMEIGLVDEMGDLEAAIAGAAEMAGLDTWRVNYIARKPPFAVSLLRDLMKQAPVHVDPALGGFATEVARVYQAFEGLNRPKATVLCASCMLELH